MLSNATSTDDVLSETPSSRVTRTTRSLSSVIRQSSDSLYSNPQINRKNEGSLLFDGRSNVEEAKKSSTPSALDGLYSSFFRGNSSALMKESEEEELDALLREFSRDMTVDFKGDMWSVSETAQQTLTLKKRLFSFKKHEFGTWSRKIKICLEIGRRYLRETCMETDRVLAIILVQDMKFALTKMGKRYQFTVQGRNHAKEPISRIYEVSTSAELNIWYSQLSEAKSGGQTRILDPSSAAAVNINVDSALPDSRQDHASIAREETHGSNIEDGVIKSDVKMQTTDLEAPILVPNHGYRFWVEFHAYVQASKESLESMMESRMANMAEYISIKEELAELEYQLNT